MNIIAISGKKQTGKDATGKIIQTFLSKDKEAISLITTGTNEVIKAYLDSIEEPKGSEWEIMKFSTPLKEMVASLLGIPVEQLEAEEFKNKALPAIWNVHKITFSSKEWSFPNYDACQKFKDFLEKQGAPRTKIVYEQITMTPRKMMIFLANSVLRKYYNPMIFVNALRSKFTSGKKWIITDVRHPEEYNSVLVMSPTGSRRIRLEREDAPKLYDYSETALDKESFHKTFHNDHDLKTLVKDIREYLVSEKLLKK